MRAFLILIFGLSFLQILKAQDSTFHFITSDSVQLYVRVAGSGSACVFVHGGPGSNSNYFEATPSATLLAKQFSMVYYDQRGSGRSGSPKNKNFSLPRMLQDLEEIRQYLGYKKWAVMGHSFGGIIATQYAKDYPVTVSKLLLINCTLNVNASLSGQIEYGLKKIRPTDEKPYRDTSVLLAQRVNMNMDMLKSRDLGYSLMFRNKYEKLISDSINNLVKKPNWEFGSTVWKIPVYFSDFSLLTKSIRTPVLIITGDQDHAIGSEHYRSFKFPIATVVHYIGGHLPFQEEPQWFSEQVARFLRDSKTK
jgi:proline iminopeptidase